MNNTHSRSLKPTTSCKKCSQHRPTVKRGKVKWFLSDMGFGFVRDESGKEYYFNQFDFKAQDLPRSGDAVQFFPVQNKKGDRAGHVLPLAPELPAVETARDTRKDVMVNTDSLQATSAQSKWVGIAQWAVSIAAVLIFIAVFIPHI